LLIALSYVSMVVLMVGLLLDIFGLIFTRQIYSCADESGSQFTGTPVSTVALQILMTAVGMLLHVCLFQVMPNIIRKLRIAMIATQDRRRIGRAIV
jgi:hypothetical protein